MNETSGSSGRKGRVKSRSYYEMTDNLSKNPTGLILENEADVKHDAQRRFDVADLRVRGFSRFPKKVKPQFRHIKREGRKPLDFEREAGYWLLTDRVRAVFDAIDPAAFEYMACDITFDDGSPMVHAWLCDVVRLLDALDEEKSDVAIHDGPRKQYNLAGANRMVFRNDAVGAAHVFRIAYAAGTVICDDVMRQACREAGLRSISFIQTIYKDVIIPNRMVTT